MRHSQCVSKGISMGKKIRRQRTGITKEGEPLDAGRENEERRRRESTTKTRRRRTRGDREKA